MYTLTNEQLQVALDYLKDNMDRAAEAGDPGLCNAFADKIKLVCDELHRRIKSDTVKSLKELQNAN